MHGWDKFYPRELLIFLASAIVSALAPHMAPERLSYIITLNEDRHTSKVQSQDAPGLLDSDLKASSH